MSHVVVSEVTRRRLEDICCFITFVKYGIVFLPSFVQRILVDSTSTPPSDRFLFELQEGGGDPVTNVYQVVKRYMEHVMMRDDVDIRGHFRIKNVSKEEEEEEDHLYEYRFDRHAMVIPNENINSGIYKRDAILVPMKIPFGIVMDTNGKERGDLVRGEGVEFVRVEDDATIVDHRMKSAVCNQQAMCLLRKVHMCLSEDEGNSLVVLSQGEYRRAMQSEVTVLTEDLDGSIVLVDMDIVKDLTRNAGEVVLYVAQLQRLSRAAVGGGGGGGDAWGVVPMSHSNIFLRKDASSDAGVDFRIVCILNRDPHIRRVKWLVDESKMVDFEPFEPVKEHVLWRRAVLQDLDVSAMITIHSGEAWLSFVMVSRRVFFSNSNWFLALLNFAANNRMDIVLTNLDTSEEWKEMYVALNRSLERDDEGAASGFFWDGLQRIVDEIPSIAYARNMSHIEVGDYAQRHDLHEWVDSACALVTPPALRGSSAKEHTHTSNIPVSKYGYRESVRGSYLQENFASLSCRVVSDDDDLTDESSVLLSDEVLSSPASSMMSMHDDYTD